MSGLGCDKGQGSYVKNAGPTPKLVSVSMGSASKCTTLKPGDAFCFTDVSQQPRVTLTFDRMMAPSSVFRENYRIVSGSSSSLNFKQVRVDPVERSIVFILRDELTEGAYSLRIKSVDAPANRLAAFDGTPFEGEAVVSFNVKKGTADTEIDPPLDPMLTTVDARACAAISALQASCTGAQCHGDTKGTPPMLGLSLVNYAAIRGSAKSRSSVLVQAADDPSGSGRYTTDFPTGLPLISPKDSASSFLLYKILMDYRERPGGEKEAAALLRMSTELRKRIPGAPMPHDSLPPEPNASVFFALPMPTVRLLRQWIDDGACGCGEVACSGGTATDAGTDAADASETSTGDTSVSDTAAAGDTSVVDAMADTK